MVFRHKIKNLVACETGFPSDTARLFYLEMWKFLQSTAFTTANDNFILHDMVISKMIDDVYKGIKKVYCVI